MSKKNKVNPLDGKYFHSFTKDGIDWQGRILNEVAPGYFLIQLFSWVDGRPTNQQTTALIDMKGWKFYDSEEVWREEGVKGFAAVVNG